MSQALGGALASDGFQRNAPLTGDQATHTAATMANVAPDTKAPNVTELFAMLFPQGGAKAEQTVIGPTPLVNVQQVPTWAWLVAGGIAAWLLLGK